MTSLASQYTASVGGQTSAEDAHEVERQAELWEARARFIEEDIKAAIEYDSTQASHRAFFQLHSKKYKPPLYVSPSYA
jgi:hypothetical protein